MTNEKLIKTLGEALLCYRLREQEDSLNLEGLTMMLELQRRYTPEKVDKLIMESIQMERIVEEE